MTAILRAFFAALWDAFRDWRRDLERDEMIAEHERAEADRRAARSELEQLGRMADAPKVSDADDARRRMRGRDPGTR